MTDDACSRVLVNVLGPVRVHRADRPAAADHLTEPRPLSVLLYLTLARPRGLHSRDTLLALLWPESTQSSARHALRNALHVLRVSLGERVIVTAGDQLVGVDASQVECDALLLEADLAAGRTTEALARCEGELLQGFHVSRAPDFERWMDAQRSRVREALRRGQANSSFASD